MTKVSISRERVKHTKLGIRLQLFNQCFQISILISKYLKLSEYELLSFYSIIQAFRFMGWPGSLSHDFKIWPITFQGSGPSGPILFICEKSHFNKKYTYYSESTNFAKQKVHAGCQYS